MTACRHHVLEQGFCPKTNGAYTWWPLSVVSGLAQASYTVQRIEAQATSKTKKQKKPKKQKNQKNQTKQKTKKTKIWPNIALGRLVANFFFFFVWLVSLFSFRKFSEILRNGRFLIDFWTLSIVSGLFSETRLFAAPIRSASLKLMWNRCLSWTAQKQFWPIFIGQSTFVSYCYRRCCYSKKHILAKSTDKYYAAMMLNFNVFHHCINSLTLAHLVYE